VARRFEERGLPATEAGIARFVFAAAVIVTAVVWLPFMSL
jgi:hypothetical protein